MLEGSDELNRTLNEYLAVAVRRRWLILLTACGVALLTVGVSLLIPDHYRSEATIIIQRQQVPERYVTPTSTADITEALQAMTQDVLSRPRLMQIISDFGLYQKERRLVPDELVELIRENITIKALESNPERRNVNAFQISFTNTDPHVAQQVTSRLTSLFIEENLKTRELQATGTTNFLEDQVAAARAQLQKHEQRLRDFKMQYLGELPEQQQGNLEILGGLHMQLQNAMAALSRAQEQKVYLGSLLTQYRNLASAGGPLPGSPGSNTIETVEQELTRLRTQQASLLARYKPQYPDVIKISQQIAETEALLDRLKKDAKTSEEAQDQGATAATRGPDRGTTIAQLESQLKANQIEIENATRDEKRLEEEIARYQQRLNLTPVREQQLADIVRDYNQAKQNYEDLLSKRTQSQLAANLEHRQQGQQFRIVDPPSLPTKAMSPNRLQISLVGTGFGLVLAAGLAFLAEIWDRSMHTESDVRRYFTVPLVLAVPALLTPAEEAQCSRRGWLEWAGGSALVLAVLAAEFFVYWRS